MCGIVGIFDPRGTVAPERALDATRAMLTAIRHRGPDEAISVLMADGAMGHARLNLRGGAAGRQPIIDANTGVAMSYDGELYAGLGGVAHVKANDTVQMLHGYLANGVDFFQGINAEFALAIVDPRSRSLTLVRDRWGTKPLYFTRTAGAIIFCSEVKGLYASGLVKRELDPAHLLTSLLRVDTRRSTPFLHVHTVPPGGIVTFRADGSPHTRRFGDAQDMLGDLADTCQDTPEEAAETVLGLLRQAVVRRMDADQMPGAFVSGGLDSSLIARIMVETAPETRTYTISFTDHAYDESGWAKLASAHAGLRNDTIEVSPDDQAHHFGEAIFHAEQFVQLTDGVAKLLLARRAQRDVRSVLVGEGSDELFLGYPSHLRAAANDLGRAGLIERAERQTTQRGLDDVTTVADTLSSQSRQTRLMERALGNILGDAVRDQINVDSTLARFREESGFASVQTAVRAEQIAALRLTLPEYLFSYLGGKIEMAASVESRYPFLDLDLVRYVFSLPVTTLLAGETEKGVLRMGARRILPRALVDRPKHGFSAPILPGALRESALSGRIAAMTPGRIDELGFFDSSAVRELLISLRTVGRFDDEDRVARERLAVFIVSVQLMQEMMVRRAVPSSAAGRIA